MPGHIAGDVAWQTSGQTDGLTAGRSDGRKARQYLAKTGRQDLAETGRVSGILSVRLSTVPPAPGSFTPHMADRQRPTGQIKFKRPDNSPVSRTHPATCWTGAHMFYSMFFLFLYPASCQTGRSARTPIPRCMPFATHLHHAPLVALRAELNAAFLGQRLFEALQAPLAVAAHAAPLEGSVRLGHKGAAAQCQAQAGRGALDLEINTRRGVSAAMVLQPQHDAHRRRCGPLGSTMLVCRGIWTVGDFRTRQPSA
jgi:hypothetical protein